MRVAGGRKYRLWIHTKKKKIKVISLIFMKTLFLNSNIAN